MGRRQVATSKVSRRSGGTSGLPLRKPCSSGAKSSIKQRVTRVAKPRLLRTTVAAQSGPSGAVVQRCRPEAVQCATCATDIINGSTHDPRFWGMLLTEPGVKDFLARSLVARAEEDYDFAKLVVAAAAMLSEPSWLRSVASTGGALESVTVDAADESLSTKKRRRKLHKGSLVTKRRRVVSGRRASAPMIPAHLDSCVASAHSEDVVASASCVTTAPPTCSLGALSTDLFTEVLVCVDLKTKICGLLSASRSMKQSMQCGAAWDPLCFDQETGRSLLRMLKKHDPLACFGTDVARTKGLLPMGLFDVSRLRVVLMDPERVEPVQSDTEDEAPKPRVLAIGDPLDEVCRRMRHYFTNVKEFLVSNIEDFRMDYRFLGLRSGSLSKFGFVELSYCDTGPTRTYTLFAKYDAPPRLIDVSSAASENRSRVPSDVHIEDGTTFSEREALYLAEHRSAFKNADHFHFQHAKFRTVRSHAVRKSYIGVIASLRERFPQQFSNDADPRSPAVAHTAAYRP